MKRSITLGALILLPALLDAGEPPAGFKSLYNGKDLSGWFGWGTRDPRDLLAMTPAKLAEYRKQSIEGGAAVKADQINAHWKADGEEIVNDGNGLYLTTDKDYGDIELLVDYKMKPKGDSGIYLRGVPQIQIWDYTDPAKFGIGADKGSGGLWNNEAGSPGKDPLVLADKPFGEWNHFRIILVGNRVTVWLNDKLVVEHAILENYFDKKLPPAQRRAILPQGPIQLQTHGSEIRWKNIFVREIGSEEAKRLLAGKSGEGIKPVRSEVITPLRSETFTKNGKARERKQGGNPRTVNGVRVFDGSMDGDRQVDPQIAVGNGFVLHGTNNGIIIYDKDGKFLQGVPQSEFNNGIDPKLFFDLHHRVFAFDFWNPWDQEKKKPVNVSVSETADPRGAWNTYPVPAPGGVDGGGNGHSRQWLGYSFPGGPERTFVMKMAELKAGQPATVYHFAGHLGHPVQTQDPMDELYFVELTDQDIVITKVADGGDGAPVVAGVARKPHGFKHFGWPPQSPQKGTQQKTASGDRNPKNLVLQSGHIWFSHAVNVDGRAAVQWHQVKLDGSIVQSGLIADPQNSYIQTTIAVNQHNDVLLGFQETGPDRFISPRCALHLATDPPGTTRKTISLGEGQGATDGTAWGDYSGSVVDSDNLTDFWTIQSITDEKGKGDTVIALIPAKPTAAEPPTPQ